MSRIEQIKEIIQEASDAQFLVCPDIVDFTRYAQRIKALDSVSPDTEKLMLTDKEIRFSMMIANKSAQEYDEYGEPIPERAVAKAQLAEIQHSKQAIRKREIGNLKDEISAWMAITYLTSMEKWDAWDKIWQQYPKQGLKPKEK